MKNWIVITSINSKTEAICSFEGIPGWHMVIVGDKKSRAISSSECLTFLSIEDQAKLGYAFHDVCPYNHYTRKNIGYLYAISRGAEVIYDTDDDNVPKQNWAAPAFICSREILGRAKFLNIYRYFTDAQIWPRGYPLDLISARAETEVLDGRKAKIGVWQGLADSDPDVDAIYRLVLNRKITFKEREPVFLGKGIYCPFNSQNTFWDRELFPLLYLPATTSFRFTDILRSYIAQRLMWDKDLHLAFMSATVLQVRNAHDLLKDLLEEVECYVSVKPVVEMLDSMTLPAGTVPALRAVYAALAAERFVKDEEVALLDCWLEDYMKMTEDAYAEN